jgi:uncharacterized iron-regulated protein
MLFILFTLAQAFAYQPGTYYTGNSLSPISLQEIVTQVKSGDIVIIGEEHNQAQCASAQLQMMRALQKNGLLVSVGMEFLDFTQQDLVNQYRSGMMSESEFLKSINWGSFNFDYYRDQILFPDAQYGQELVALNAPRSLSSKVARSGLGSLTEQEKALLPPNFTRGRDSYFERFQLAIGHVKDPQQLESFFLAQSLWDDTMAFQALEFMSRNPSSVLVIVVGEFHSQYGGGLPDRILARGFKGNIWTVSQVRASEASEIAPSPKYGDRASFIWLF